MKSNFPYDAEAREELVIQLIDARIYAIKHDIRVNRVSTLQRVLERLEIGETTDEAALLLRQAVTGHSAAVGVDVAAAVELAIFQEAEQLAEKDVADMERHRAEQAREERIELRVWERFFSQEVA